MRNEKEIKEALENDIREYRSRFTEELKEPLPEDWIRPWLLGQIDTLKWMLRSSDEE